MSTLPSISMVVPNFNGGKTLRLALQSLVDQQYPSLEIIVVDGGSTDDSVAIIRQFEQHIAWWVSEKDGGQTQALNKGFAHCSGEIVNWLCSDDWLETGALRRVGEEFAAHPETDLLVGGARFVDERVSPPRVLYALPREVDLALLPFRNFIPQSSCFYRRQLLDRNPPLDENYPYMMDFELWNYLHSRGAQWRFIPDVLSTYVFTGTNKSSVGGEVYTIENQQIFQVYGRDSRMKWDRWRRCLNKCVARHPGVPGIGVLTQLRRLVTVLMMLRFGPHRIGRYALREYKS